MCNNKRVTTKVEFNRIKIYIDNFLHISMPKDSNTKIQSWYEDSALYKVEIYNSGHLDEYHYEDINLWKEILTALDSII